MQQPSSSVLLHKCARQLNKYLSGSTIGKLLNCYLLNDVNYDSLQRLNLLHISLFVVRCHLLKRLLLLCGQLTPLDRDSLCPLGNLQCIACVRNSTHHNRSHTLTVYDCLPYCCCHFHRYCMSQNILFHLSMFSNLARFTNKCT